MRNNRRMPGSKMSFAALLMSLFFVGASLAQEALPVYCGKFTLTEPIHWGKSVLQSGDYTITIESAGAPVFALIRDGRNRPVAAVMTNIRSGNTTAVNALLLKEKDGQLWVHTLALADLKVVLIFDPVLARQSIQEAQVSKTVPVMWAKK
jgi:hypothetical protein